MTGPAKKSDCSSDYSTFFEEHFSPETLISTFESKFKYTRSKGVDRINGFQFADRASDVFTQTSRKVLSGEFRFSPYLEDLRFRGRARTPRLIGIPTVRDRVVLHQLRECLVKAFADSVPRNIASIHVKNVITELAQEQPNQTYVCRSDIQDFYGSIDRNRLLKVISLRLEHPLTFALIRRALLTPTVPENAKHRDYKKYFEQFGVPQGLAVSNILAAVYLRDVDDAMVRFGVHYRRYVDDILMHGSRDQVMTAHRSLVARLRSRKLRVHALVNSDKGHFAPLTEPFGYLGYFFKWPVVTVRDSTIERLIQSLAAKFSEYLHNKDRRLERRKYLTPDRLGQIFLDELNERITGALSENKRYGWISYFSEINEKSLLYKLDVIVAAMFERMPDFDRKPPSGLKRFARAYYEMKFNVHGGYIKDYDRISTASEKLAFLVRRGLISPDAQLTEYEIQLRFEFYKHRVLSKMLADEGIVY